MRVSGLVVVLVLGTADFGLRPFWSLPEIGMAGPVVALDIRRGLLWPIVRFVSAVFVCVVDMCTFVPARFSLALVSR